MLAALETKKFLLILIAAVGISLTSDFFFSFSFELLTSVEAYNSNI